jgi:uridine phosphorylase
MRSFPEFIGGLPILTSKHYDAPSVLTPRNLLREARRQKQLPLEQVPKICVLDPDGDLVDYLRASKQTQRHDGWACYHTSLDTFAHAGTEYGIIGRTVGGSFSVLVAEELFESGCELLINISSAGQIIPLGPPPYVMLIEKALRDEGTSYHYLPPSTYCQLDPILKNVVMQDWNHAQVPLYVGASWTTDAPFRETEAMLEVGRAYEIYTVEMESAALYALGTARQKQIICFAYVTNLMGCREGDFEKGVENGSITNLQIIHQTAQNWLNWHARNNEIEIEIEIERLA